MSCVENNFDGKFDNSLDFVLELESNSLDALVNDIMSVLTERRSVSTDVESSEDPESYTDSILEIVDTIERKLKEKEEKTGKTKNKLKFIISSDEMYGKLKTRLCARLLPSKLTKVDEEIKAVIPSQKMLSSEKVRALKFEDVLKRVYGDNIVIRNYAEKQFKATISAKTIIDTNTKTIIDGTKTLNENLRIFKNQLFKVLSSFIKNIAGKEGKFSDNIVTDYYYYGNNSSTKVDDAYAIMYNYIEYLKEKGIYYLTLEASYEDKLNNKPSPFFDAVMAYTNLQFFDDMLKLSFSNYMKINWRYDEPVTVEGTETYYKYTLKGDNKLAKGWETAEYQDAIDRMSNYCKTLMDIIPLYDYETKRRRTVGNYSTLDSTVVTNAFCSLIEAINNLSQELRNTNTSDKRLTNNELKDLLYSTLNSPDNWIDILTNIFGTKSTTLLNRLKDVLNFNGKIILNEFDLNVLYSFYDTVLNKTKSNSFVSIEDDYTKLKGTTDRYSIVDTLLGYINSTAAMNYLESSYTRDGDNSDYVIKIKRKFNSNTSTFDIVKEINRNIAFNDHSDLLKEYDFKFEPFTNSEGQTVGIESEKFAKVTINGHDFFIDFGGLTILDKSAKGKFLEDEFSKQIVDDTGKLLIDLSVSNRENVMSEPEYETFRKMLKFIDNMLNTTFSYDIEGLTELNQFIKQGGKFMDLITAACRGGRIAKIYQDLLENGKYSLQQVLQFLKENEDAYKDPLFKSRSQFNDLIKKDTKGAYLSTVSNNDSWITTLATSRMILNGSVSKSVTKNFDMDNVPNFSPTFLGSEIKLYLRDARIAETSSSNLLFSENEDAIKGVVIDTDVKFRNGKSKPVKKMTAKELVYHSIVDKFLNPLKKSTNVIILSTTFSDKTKYVGHIINLSDLDINPYKSDLKTKCTKKLFETVGAFYKEIFQNVLDDYHLIYGKLIENNEGNVDIVKLEDLLNTKSEQDLISDAFEKGVKLYKDVSYRISGGKAGLNELLYHYATDLYSSIENLTKRLNIERALFVNDLIRIGSDFFVERDEKGNIITTNAIGNFISKYGIDSFTSEKNKINNWITGNRLIFAKVFDEKGNWHDVTDETVDLDRMQSIILNPILESYFSIDVLTSNNLRFSLTGTELNHKIKTDIRISKNISQEIPKGSSIVKAIELLKGIVSDENASEVDKQIALDNIKDIQNNTLYSIEAAAQGALLKRNVIIPATMRVYLLNRINGIPPEMECAIIDDVQAYVLSFDGSGCFRKGKYKSVTIDAHDGFALIHPIMSDLENKSLQDNEVGDMKKNILHDFDHRLGDATLFKYAAGSMTNAWMRDSEGSPISLRRLFKKMSSKRWSLSFQDGTKRSLLTDNPENVVNLCKSEYKKEDYSDLDFATDILQGRELFYEDRGVKKQIIDFGIDEKGDYYTIERVVQENGVADITKEDEKVYHYFDNEGNHLTSSSRIDLKFDENNNEIYHTIDTIYELWTVMGGLNSLEKVRDNKGRLHLVESEASIHTTTNFVNFVSFKKPGSGNTINQLNYDLPLKRAFIAYAVNNTAIKNGAGMQNPSERYYDDKPLTTIKIKTKGHGVLLDADHEADEAEMTEFSQVITSLDSGGRMHNYVKLIYQALGRVAIDLSEIELDAVKLFKETGNKTKIYDLLGRTIIKNIKDGQKGLLKAIMTEVKKEFNLNTDHDLDVFKIPFDDPNIYSQILSTFVSIINKKSIKRQYPGSGMVMMPGYDIETIYEHNGNTYQYIDLVRLAKSQVPSHIKDNIVAKDNADWNKQLVDIYLSGEQNKYEKSNKADWVYPADRVNIYVNDKLSGDIIIESLEDYYNFKDQFTRNQLIASKLYNTKINETDDSITISNNSGIITLLKTNDGKYLFSINETSLASELEINNLFASATILVSDGHEIVIDNVENEEYLDIFKDYFGFVETDGLPPTIKSMTLILFLKNITKPRNLKPAEIKAKIELNGEPVEVNIFDSDPIKLLYTKGIRIKSAIQAVMDGLNEGVWKKGHYDETLKEFIFDEDIPIIQGSLVNNVAECIVPNIYASKFNLDQNASLNEVLEDNYIAHVHDTFFKSGSIDLAFTKNNGDDTFITFKPVKSNSNTFESRLINFNDIVVQELPKNKMGVIQSIYAVDENNVKMFEIGRYIIDDSVIWNDKEKEYQRKLSNEEKEKLNTKNDYIAVDDLSLYKRYKDKVLKAVYFIEKRSVHEVVTKKQGSNSFDVTEKYTLYNINRNALLSVYIESDSNKTVDDYIGKILSDIYDSDEFNSVLINNRSLHKLSAITLRNSLTQFANRQQHNPALNKLLNDYKDLLLKEISTRIEENKTENDFIKNKDIKFIQLNSIKYGNIKKKYRNSLSEQVKTSFMKSLYFTSSRIPAQSHQSFMLMKAVGFTRGNVTHTFVSHFLTFLQGSDY